jgi:predicted O-methyltransferase YrrM
MSRTPLTDADLPHFFGTEELRNGRNVADGYTRGWGIQYGGLKEKILRDPLYQDACAVSAQRTIVQEENRMNLFLIMRFFLARLSRGNIIEFGSFRGGNAIFMAYVARHLFPGVKVFTLDTFDGMPDTNKQVDAHSRGDFAGVDLPELRDYSAKLGLDNLHFVKGLFEDTADAVVADAAPFSLAHIDCDIFSAVKYSYECVKKNMVPGAYLVFDDATVSSCIGATEVVEDLLIRRDGLNSEQIYPHFVFRARAHQ